MESPQIRLDAALNRTSSSVYACLQGILGTIPLHVDLDIDNTAGREGPYY